MINLKKIEINNDTTLHILNIEELSDDLEELIDENLGKIHSNDKYDLATTKIILINLFSTRKLELSDVKMGMIAEFFIHLYLKEIGFTQLCLLQNLESLNDIKKGHDGYYSFNNEEWLMESKSTRSIPTHGTLVDKAYKDLKNKVSGKSISSSGKLINPWDNTWNHLHRVNPNSNILEKIHKLSTDFIAGTYKDIKDFNIIPSSTIFLEDSISLQKSEDIESEISGYIKGMDCNGAHIICITQKTVDLFLEYLNK